MLPSDNDPFGELLESEERRAQFGFPGLAYYSSPEVAQGITDLIRTYPHLEPEVLHGIAQVAWTNDMPFMSQTVDEIARIQRDEHNSFLDSMWGGVKWGSRNLFGVADSIYDSMPHTYGLRMATGLVQGMGISEAAEQATGRDYLSMAIGAASRGEDYTGGEGFFIQPQEPMEIPEVRAAYVAHIKAQRKAGVEPPDLDFQAAYEAALAAAPLDLGAKGIEQAERIQMTSRHGGPSVPVSVGRLLTMQLTKPGSFLYNTVSGMIDAPFLMGADPLNQPFWALEEWATSRRFLRPLSGQAPTTTVTAPSQPEGFVKPLVFGTEQIDTFPDFVARRAEARETAATTHRKSQSRTDRDLLDAGDDDWEAWVRLQDEAGSTLPQATADPLLMGEAARQAAIPVAPRFLNSKTMQPYTGHLGPQSLLDRPFAENGGIDQARLLVERLLEDPTVWAARQVDQMRAGITPVVHTEAERQRILAMVSAQDVDADEAAVFVASASDEDRAWFAARFSEMDETVTQGRQARQALLEHDTLANTRTARNEMARDLEDQLDAVDSRITDLENNLAPRPAVVGADVGAIDGSEVRANPDLPEPPPPPPIDPNLPLESQAAWRLDPQNSANPLPGEVKIIPFGTRYQAPIDGRRRILFSGARKNRTLAEVRQALLEIKAVDPEAVIVHGFADGVDSYVDKVARELGFAVEAHPVRDWDWKPPELGGKTDRSAGPRRNVQMANSGVDFLVAFPEEGGSGTQRMMESAAEMGIPTEIRWRGREVEGVTLGNFLSTPVEQLPDRAAAARYKRGPGTAWADEDLDDLEVAIDTMGQIDAETPDLGAFREYGAGEEGSELRTQIYRRAQLAGEQGRAVSGIEERKLAGIEFREEGLTPTEGRAAAEGEMIPVDMREGGGRGTPSQELRDLHAKARRIRDQLAGRQPARLTTEKVDPLTDRFGRRAIDRLSEEPAKPLSKAARKRLETELGAVVAEIKRLEEVPGQRRTAAVLRMEGGGGTGKAMAPVYADELTAADYILEQWPEARTSRIEGMDPPIDGLMSVLRQQADELGQINTNRIDYLIDRFRRTKDPSELSITAVKEMIDDATKRMNLLYNKSRLTQAERDELARLEQVLAKAPGFEEVDRLARRRLSPEAQAKLAKISEGVTRRLGLDPAGMSIDEIKGAKIGYDYDIDPFEAPRRKELAETALSSREIEALEREIGKSWGKASVVPGTKVLPGEALSSATPYQRRTLLAEGEVSAADMLDDAAVREALRRPDKPISRKRAGTARQKVAYRLGGLEARERQTQRAFEAGEKATVQRVNRMRRSAPKPRPVARVRSLSQKETVEKGVLQTLDELSDDQLVDRVVELYQEGDLPRGIDINKLFPQTGRRRVRYELMVERTEGVIDLPRSRQLIQDQRLATMRRIRQLKSTQSVSEVLGEVKPVAETLESGKTVVSRRKVRDTLRERGIEVTSDVDVSYSITEATDQLRKWEQLAKLDDIELERAIRAGETPMSQPEKGTTTHAVWDQETGQVEDLEPDMLSPTRTRAAVHGEISRMSAQGRDAVELVGQEAQVVASEVITQPGWLPKKEADELRALREVANRYGIKPLQMTEEYPVSRTVEAILDEPELTVAKRTPWVNIKASEQYDVYVGRASSVKYRNRDIPGSDGKWGNPFWEGSPQENVDAFGELLRARIREDISYIDELAELSGKRLGCFCAPDPCHASKLSASADWARDLIELMGPTSGWDEAARKRVLQGVGARETVKAGTVLPPEGVTLTPEFRTAVGDIWKHKGADAIVITTNGFMKSKGEAVMGAGLAKQAMKRYPDLPASLGQHLRRNGNVPAVIGETAEGVPIVSFPVKPASGPGGQPGWGMDADPDLIRESVAGLKALADSYGWQNVVMPPPGTGNGRLPLPQVGPLLMDLDSRFIVTDFNQGRIDQLLSGQAAPPSSTPDVAAEAQRMAEIEARERAWPANEEVERSIADGGIGALSGAAMEVQGRYMPPAWVPENVRGRFRTEVLRRVDALKKRPSEKQLKAIVAEVVDQLRPVEQAVEMGPGPSLTPAAPATAEVAQLKQATASFVLPNGQPTDEAGFLDYLSGVTPREGKVGLPLPANDRLAIMQVVYGLEDLDIPLESVLADNVVLLAEEFAPGPISKATGMHEFVQGAGVPLVKRTGKSGKGVGIARQLAPKDFDTIKLNAAAVERARVQRVEPTAIPEEAALEERRVSEMGEPFGGGLEPGQRATLREELDEIDSELQERGMSEAENVNEGFGSAEDEAAHYAQIEAEEAPLRARRAEIIALLEDIGIDPFTGKPYEAGVPRAPAEPDDGRYEVEPRPDEVVDPDPDVTAELIHQRAERARIQELLEANPPIDPVGDPDPALIAAQDAAREVEGSHAALADFNARFGNEVPPQDRDALLAQLVAEAKGSRTRGRRTATAEQLAAELELDPVEMQKSVDLLREMGVITANEAGELMTTATLNLETRQHLDYLEELDRTPAEVLRGDVNTEVTAQANEWRREVLTELTDNRVAKRVRRDVGRLPDELSGRHTTDDMILRRRVQRAQDVRKNIERHVRDSLDEALDEMATAGISRYRKARKGAKNFRTGFLDPNAPQARTSGRYRDAVLRDMGFDVDEYVARATKRVERWVMQAEMDYAQIGEQMRAARAYATQIGSPGDEDTINFLVDELLDAKAPGRHNGPLGRNGATYEEMILRAQTPDAAQSVVDDLVRTNEAAGLPIERRPWISQQSGDAQFAKLERKGFFDTLAQGGAYEAHKLVGDLPRDSLRRIVNTTDPEEVKEVIRGHWLKEFSEMPELRRNPAQMAAGRRPRIRKSGEAVRDIDMNGLDHAARSVERDVSGPALWRRRWFAQTQGGMINLDRDNVAQAMTAATEWLDTLGAPLETREKILRAMLEADDGVEDWKPIREMFTEAFGARLRQLDMPEAMAAAIEKKWSFWQGHQQQFFADAIGQSMESATDKFFTAYGGKEKMAAVMAAISPHIEAELARRFITLPPISDVRRITSRGRRFMDKFRNSPLAFDEFGPQVVANMAMSVWKDAALLRMGWPVKFVGDELARMASVGYSQYMGAGSLIAYIAGKGDHTLIGSTWKAEQEMFGGIGVGWFRDIRTGLPIEGMSEQFVSKHWVMGTNSDHNYWPQLYQALRSMNKSQTSRLVATFDGVEGALKHLTSTPSGQAHLLEMSRQVNAGERLSSVLTEGDLRLVLEQTEASMAYLAGGEFLYRRPIPDAKGKITGYEDWRSSGTGRPVDPKDVPPGMRPDQEVFVRDPGHDWVWDLYRNGMDGTDVPEGSTWKLIYELETTDTGRYFYPVTTEGEAIGPFTYQASKFTQNWEVAVAAAGESGRVKVVEEAVARRALSKARRTDAEWFDFKLEDSPRDIAAASVAEYRAHPNPQALTEVPEDLRRGSTIHFDVQENTADLERQIEALKKKYERPPQTSPSGKPLPTEWSGPARLKMPTDQIDIAAAMGDMDRNGRFREAAYDLIISTATEITRSPFGRMKYWDEIARFYLYVPDETRALMRKMARKSDMAGDFEKMVRNQQRSHGYRVGEEHLPNPSIEDLDEVEIHNIAMDKSARAVRDTLYDQTKSGNLADASRLIVAFGEAWWEVLSRWSRLMNPAYNPRSLRNMRRLEQVVAGAHNNGWFQEDGFGNEVFVFPEPLSFLNDIGMAAVIDPSNQLFVNPNEGLGGLLPGMTPPGQLAAAVVIPHLSPTLRDAVGLVSFGNFPVPDASWSDLAMNSLPSGFKHLFTMVLSEEYSREMADETVDAAQALMASGRLEYNPLTPEGQRRLLEESRTYAGTTGVLRAAGAFLFPVAPKYEAMVEVAQMHADGEIVTELFLLDVLRREYQAAQEIYGDTIAANTYMLERFGIDPFGLLSATVEIRPHALTEEPFNYHQSHPELREYAKTTGYYFMPDDPDGDFFPYAYADGIREGDRERIELDQVGDLYARSAGYAATTANQLEFERLAEEAVLVLGVDTPQYAQRMANLRDQRVARNNVYHRIYWNEATQPSVEGLEEQVTYEKMLAELRNIGTPGSEANQALRPFNPELVDFYTILDDVWRQATAYSEADGTRSTTWWLSAEYGLNTDGEVREANEIKEWVTSGLAGTMERMRDPQSKEAAKRVLDEIIAPLITGFEEGKLWIPNLTPYTPLNPAELGSTNQRRPVPDGEHVIASVQRP